jgi:hypothetical protein
LLVRHWDHGQQADIRIDEHLLLTACDALLYGAELR